MKPATYCVSVGILAIVSLAFGAPAWSQQAAMGMDMQPYVGGSVGVAKWSELDDSCNDIDDVDCSTTSFAAKAFGGVDLNPYLGVEAGFAYLGDVGVAGTDEGEAFKFDYEPTSLYAALMGKIPISDSGSLFAKLGVQRWKVDVSGEDIDGSSVKGSVKGTDLLLGLGYRHVLANGLGIRVEWERFTLGDFDEDIDFFSVGVEVRF